MSNNVDEKPRTALAGAELSGTGTAEGPPAVGDGAEEPDGVGVVVLEGGVAELEAVTLMASF